MVGTSCSPLPEVVVETHTLWARQGCLAGTGDGSQKGDHGGSRKADFGSQKGDHLSPIVFDLVFLVFLGLAGGF